MVVEGEEERMVVHIWQEDGGVAVMTNANVSMVAEEVVVEVEASRHSWEEDEAAVKGTGLMKVSNK